MIKKEDEQDQTTTYRNNVKNQVNIIRSLDTKDKPRKNMRDKKTSPTIKQKRDEGIGVTRRNTSNQI